MPRTLPALITLVALAGVAGHAAAETPLLASPSRGTEVTLARPGIVALVHGVVKDDAGQAVVGVSVLAMGATLAVATSDAVGHFTLALPPGEYVLRAIRAGYFSTFREQIRIQTSAAVERNITLLRSLVDLDQADSSPTPAMSPVDHAHSETAWRLRHLPRTVLRDDGRSSFTAAAAADRRKLAASTPAIDLSGEVNLLTSGAIRAASGGATNGSPHGIAYVAVGAPLGDGDWTLRTALAGQGFSSWTVAADYAARDEEPHAIRVGLSYGSQTIVALPDAALSAVSAAPLSRSVGAIDLSDRWRVRPGFELSYGARLARYDYLEHENLVSPRMGMKIALFPRVSLSSAISNESIAPGSDEFLPPSSSGPWLPPERTFSSLDPSTGLRSEIARRIDTGVNYQIDARGTTIGFHRVSESTMNQLSSLFGADEGSEVGHYTVANAGTVDVNGWAVGAGGQLAPHVRGTIEYFSGQATWRRGEDPQAFLADASRFGHERLNDLQMSLDATIPRTSTRLKFALRGNTARSSSTDADVPLARCRFDVELRQDLPYRPLGGGRINLLLTIRTLMRAVGAPTSFYDELLTVRPPTRVMGGLQMSF